MPTYEATRELLAPRADVWAFLSEPYNLPDWWPGISGLQPDRRGFAPGARWQVFSLERLPLMGWREPKRATTLVLGDVEPLERWTWHLTGELPLDVEIHLAAAAADRTLVEIAVAANPLAGPGNLARTGVDRLYELVQTAAEL